jgi:hypothetical protein
VKQTTSPEQSRPFGLEIGFAHAVGPALGAVLRPLLAQVAARRAVRRMCLTRHCVAGAQAQRVGGKVADGRQLHAGNKARSSRYGLKGISPEIHGIGVERAQAQWPKSSVG